MFHEACEAWLAVKPCLKLFGLRQQFVIKSKLVVVNPPATVPDLHAEAWLAIGHV